MNDLDPKLHEFAERGAREIPVPALATLLSASSGGRRGVSPAVAAALLVVAAASTAALGGGFANEIFRSGNVSAVGSREVTLNAARAAHVPLPASERIGNAWQLREVQLTTADAWTSVDLHYTRPGSRGMNIGVWSAGIEVRPTSERWETSSISGRAVELGSSGNSVLARFADRGATVVIRAFADEVSEEELRSLVADWIALSR